MKTFRTTPFLIACLAVPLTFACVACKKRGFNVGKTNSADAGGAKVVHPKAWSFTSPGRDGTLSQLRDGSFNVKMSELRTAKLMVSTEVVPDYPSPTDKSMQSVVGAMHYVGVVSKDKSTGGARISAALNPAIVDGIMRACPQTTSAFGPAIGQPTTASAKSIMVAINAAISSVKSDTTDAKNILIFEDEESTPQARQDLGLIADALNDCAFGGPRSSRSVKTNDRLNIWGREFLPLGETTVEVIAYIDYSGSLANGLKLPLYRSENCGWLAMVTPSDGAIIFEADTGGSDGACVDGPLEQDAPVMRAPAAPVRPAFADEGSPSDKGKCVAISPLKERYEIAATRIECANIVMNGETSKITRKGEVRTMYTLGFEPTP